MEDLELAIKTLEEEKELLLKEKEVNLEAIKECEQKISHYKYLYNYYLSLQHVKESQRNGYQNILDYSNEHVNLLDMFPSSNNDVVRKRISTINSELATIRDTKKGLFYLYNYYDKKKAGLESRNREIVEKILELDEDILDVTCQKSEEKVYKLERGN